MTLTIIGDIIMLPYMCLKCGKKMTSFVHTNVSCDNCGAVYEFKSRELKDRQIEFSYEFDKFKCCYSDFNVKCDNSCPGPYMYCMSHLDDKTFKKIREQLQYAEKRCEEIKDKISKMEESKKNWLINKVSNIDE